MAANDTQLTLPLLDTPLVEGPSGKLTIPWYKFLVNVFQKLGAGSVPGGVYLQLINGVITAFQAITGENLGDIITADTPGQPAIALDVGGSPWSWKAPSAGFVIVFASQVEITRGLLTVQAGLQGGAYPVRAGDSLTLTWFGDLLPTATFFPD